MEADSTPNEKSPGSAHEFCIDLALIYAFRISFFQSATVSIDDCDTALATKYGSQLGPQWACANTSVQVLESRYADIVHSMSTIHVVMMTDIVT
jgi:hypothetical protein